jgi:hypothetical protein
MEINQNGSVDGSDLRSFRHSKMSVIILIQAWPRGLFKKGPKAMPVSK